MIGAVLDVPNGVLTSSQLESFRGYLPDTAGPLECWDWSGTYSAGNQPMFRVGDTMHYAYRVAILVFHGELPPGSLVRRQCRNKQCVNPVHCRVYIRTE